MPRNWIIGAAPESDIVVDAQTVSGRHCRLTLDSGRHVLEDLGSTNGTFVNGARIHGPVVVTPADRITLGTTTPMPWPKPASSRRGAKELTIGRDPENDFVVPLATVSGRHARLVWGGRPGIAEIEDLGSSNGTAVGSPDQRAARSILTAEDMVYFGTHAVPGSHLLSLLDPSVTRPLRFSGTEAVVGGGAGCDVVIDLPSLSSRHARLVRSGGRTTVEDLNSAAGTYVNGRRVVGTAILADGDVLALGPHTFRATFAPARTARPAPAGAEPVAWTPLFEESTRGPSLAKRVGFLIAPAFPAGIAAAMVSKSGAVPAALSWLGIAAATLGYCDAVFGLGKDRKSPETWWPDLGALAGAAAAQAAILWGIVVALGELTATGVGALPYLALAALVGLAAGVFTVAATPEGVSVRAAVLPVVVFLALFGGEVWPLSKMPAVARPLAASTPSRWAFEGTLSLEAAPTPGGPDAVEAYFPVENERMGPTACLGSLILMLVGWAGATAIMVRPAASGSPGRVRPASSTAP